MRFKSEIIVIACLTVLTFLIYSLSLFVPRQIKEPIVFEVKDGEAFRDVIERLTQQGLLSDKALVLLIASLTGMDREIKKGFYRFEGWMSSFQILKRLLRGDVLMVKVTVPEGFNIFQIADRLHGKGLADRETFLRTAFSEKILRELQIDAPSVEGYLYPDTYLFPLGASVEEIIRTMVKNLRSHFTEQMLRRMEELGLSEREVLTLASLVEKEAKVDEERPLIAAVFFNRLKKGLPLESDPTAVYGVKPLAEGITKQDLKRKTPYNTYIIKGLPPGPIASPGLKSIEAVLYPADVPYLYFVSMKNGRHYFSTTLKEHIRAIERFRP